MATALTGEQLTAIETRVAAFFAEEKAAPPNATALPVELTLTIGRNAIKHQRTRNTAATIVYVDKCAAGPQGTRVGNNLVMPQSRLRAESTLGGGEAACDTFNFLHRDRCESYSCHFLEDVLGDVADPEKRVTGEGVDVRVFSLTNDILYARMVRRNGDEYERVPLYRGPDGTDYDAMIIHESQALRVEVQYPPVVGPLRRDDLVMRAVRGTRVNYCCFETVLGDWAQKNRITSRVADSWKEYETNGGGRMRKLTRTTGMPTLGHDFNQVSYSWQWVVRSADETRAPIRTFESAIERVHSLSLKTPRPEPVIRVGSDDDDDAMWVPEDPYKNMIA